MCRFNETGGRRTRFIVRNRLSEFAANRPGIIGAKQASPQAETKEELIFVTGSRIPHRIKVSRVGTATYSPLRVMDREEIDRTGRLTTAGVLINEPSLRIIDH